MNGSFRALGPIVEELDGLARLAAPVVMVQLGLMLMGAVDTMMVGHYSPGALAAVALGNVYHWGLLVFGLGVMLALDPIVSQAWGAGDRGGIHRAFRQGLVLGGLLTVPFVVVFQFAGPILRALGQPPELVPIAAAFVRAQTLGVPAFFAFVAMRQTLQGMSIVRPVLIAVVVGNVANVVGNWALVYGHLGLPSLGAVGSGFSTSLSRWLMAGVLALAAAPALGDVWRRPWTELRDIRGQLRLLAIGLPIGVQTGLEVWVFMTVSLLMGRMGALALAGHQIAINLASLSFMVPLGIGSAAAVRVGNAIGRRDRAGARRSALTALGAGAAVMTVSATTFALLPDLLARIYTPDRAVIAAATLLLPIAALFQIFDGTQAVGCGILRGIADTRAAAAINLVGYWFLGLPIGLALAFARGLGPRGLWWGLTAGLAIVAVLLVVRIVRRFARSALQIAPLSIVELTK